jgi:hypothetical protein
MLPAQWPVASTLAQPLDSRWAVCLRSRCASAATRFDSLRRWVYDGASVRGHVIRSRVGQAIELGCKRGPAGPLDGEKGQRQPNEPSRSRVRRVKITLTSCTVYAGTSFPSIPRIVQVDHRFLSCRTDPRSALATRTSTKSNTSACVASRPGVLGQRETRAGRPRDLSDEPLLERAGKEEQGVSVRFRPGGSRIRHSRARSTIRGAR